MLQARQLLEQIAHQVQPIMRRRKLKVPILSEFFPERAELVRICTPCYELHRRQTSTDRETLQQGVNIGGGGGATHEINLRLRPASNSKAFRPYDDLVRTVLHELTHNHIGAHNKEFFRQLDELIKVSPYLSRLARYRLKTGCVAVTT